MDISSNMSAVSVNQSNSNIKTNFTKKLSKDEAAKIHSQITQNAKEMMFSSITIQSNIGNTQDSFTIQYDDFQSFLSGIGYEGKPIADLSKDEAAQLISEDGIFGIKQTSKRIANFVINGANGDEDRMRAGYEGMLQGFKDAEAMWGGKLPDISQKTMQAAIEIIDKAMSDLGFSILDQEA